MCPPGRLYPRRSVRAGQSKKPWTVATAPTHANRMVTPALKTKAPAQPQQRARNIGRNDENHTHHDFKTCGCLDDISLHHNLSPITAAHVSKDKSWNNDKECPQTALIARV